MAQARPYARAHLRGLAVASTGIVLAIGACKDDAPAAASAPTPAPVVTARDVGDVVIIEARITGTRCAVTGAAETLSIERSTTTDGPQLTARGDAGEVLTMVPGPAGLAVRGGDGTGRARVVRGNHRLDVLTPEGVPLVRVSTTDDDATLVDGSRAPVAFVRRDGAQLVATGGDGAALATITGTTDLELAALLIAPGLAADLRALLGCDRLLAGATPSTAPAHSTPAAPASPDPAVSDPTP